MQTHTNILLLSLEGCMQDAAMGGALLVPPHFGCMKFLNDINLILKYKHFKKLASSIWFTMKVQHVSACSNMK